MLRFWAVWDERGALYGDRRPYVVHYYLADDTMEVLEVHEMNSGRDPFPVFIARAPMPKTFSQPGFTVAKRVDKRACYTPTDLRIGAVLDVHNRSMLLYMCDAFTQRWYMDNLGYTLEELQPMDIREEVCFDCRAQTGWNGARAVGLLFAWHKGIGQRGNSPFALSVISVERISDMLARPLRASDIGLGHTLWFWWMRECGFVR